MSNPDNTLDDLILTDPEPEQKKSKGILALLALVILLIIVGAMLAKMIFSESSEDNTTTKNKIEINKENKDISTNNNTMSSIDTDPDLAPIDTIESNANNVDTIDIEDKEKTPSMVIKKENNNEDTENKTANNLGVAPVTDMKVKNDDDIEIEEKPKKVQKRETEKKVARDTKPKTTPKKHTYGGVGNVYIQVGSFSKGPEQSFIRKIRRAGFKYRIKTVNGYRRVYVGPFRNRTEAANVLGIVKSKINPDAFIK